MGKYCFTVQKFLRLYENRRFNIAEINKHYARRQ